ESALGGVHRAWSQLDVEDVAELSGRGDEWVEDRPAVMTVVLSARLVAFDLDWEAVDVERHIALTVAAVFGLEPTGRSFHEEAAQGGAIVLGAKRLMQA